MAIAPSGGPNGQRSWKRKLMESQLATATRLPVGRRTWRPNVPWRLGGGCRRTPRNARDVVPENPAGLGLHVCAPRLVSR